MKDGKKFDLVSYTSYKALNKATCTELGDGVQIVM